MAIPFNQLTSETNRLVANDILALPKQEAERWSFDPDQLLDLFYEFAYCYEDSVVVAALTRVGVWEKEFLLGKFVTDLSSIAVKPESKNTRIRENK